MKALTAPLLAAAIAGFASTASAATCADRARVASALEERFGERLIANSEAATGSVLQVYAADDVKTWSIVVQLDDRALACLAAAGRGRQSLDRAMARYN